MGDDWRGQKLEVGGSPDSSCESYHLQNNLQKIHLLIDQWSI